MMKPKRKKVYRAQLEKLLFKYERRIQRLAEEAYKLRQVLETMTMQEKTTLNTFSVAIQEAAITAGNELGTKTIPQEG